MRILRRALLVAYGVWAVALCATSPWRTRSGFSLAVAPLVALIVAVPLAAGVPLGVLARRRPGSRVAGFARVAVALAQAGWAWWFPTLVFALAGMDAEPTGADAVAMLYGVAGALLVGAWAAEDRFANSVAARRARGETGAS